MTYQEMIVQILTKVKDLNQEVLLVDFPNGEVVIVEDVSNNNELYDQFITDGPTWIDSNGFLLTGITEQEILDASEEEELGWGKKE